MAGSREKLVLFTVLALPGLGPVAPGPVAAQEVELDQWRNSPHARSMDSMADRLSMNQPGCAHCHTAEGYLRETLGVHNPRYTRALLRASIGELREAGG